MSDLSFPLSREQIRRLRASLIEEVEKTIDNLQAANVTLYSRAIGEEAEKVRKSPGTSSTEDLATRESLKWRRKAAVKELRNLLRARNSLHDCGMSFARITPDYQHSITAIDVPSVAPGYRKRQEAYAERRRQAGEGYGPF